MADSLKIVISGSLSKSTYVDLAKELKSMESRIPNLKIKTNLQVDTKDIELYKQKMQNALARLQIGKESVFNKKAISDELNAFTADLNKFGTIGGKSTKELSVQFDTLKTNVAQTSAQFKNVNKDGYSFFQMIELAGKKVAIWGIATSGVYLFIHQIQDAIKFINDLDKSMTNIEMITGRSRPQIQAMTRDYVELASTLHDTTSSVMKASEEFLRAGHNQAETLQLIKASTVMSKIAGQDQKQTADQLIAITNGYKMNIEETMNVVDKLTTVDNKSATSTAELGTALERTSSSAQMAGVNFDRLVAYIATVSSVTRKSASSIGESFKTIFARFQDVKGGKQFDADNDPVSNVERDLQKYADISIRSTKGQFKDFSEVIDELSAKWNNLGQVEQSAIAKALAGVRQRENFLVLMNNYNTALKLEQDQLNSNGSAMVRYQAFAKSTEARINDLTNALQKFYMQVLNSSVVNQSIAGLTSFVEVISRMVDALGGLQSVLLLITSGGLIKFILSMGKAIEVAVKAQETLTLLQAAVKILGMNVAGLEAIMAFLLNPITLLIAAVVAVTGAIIYWANEQQKLKEQALATAKAQSEFNKAMQDFTNTLDPNKVNEMAQALENLKKAVHYDESIKQIEQLKQEINDLQNNLKTTTDARSIGFDQTAIIEKKKQLKELENQIKPVIEAIKEYKKQEEIQSAMDYKSAEAKAKSAAMSIQQAGANLKLAESYKVVYDKLKDGLALTQEETELNNQLLQQYPQYAQMVNDKTKAIGVNYNALKDNLTLQQALAVAEFSGAQQSARLQIQKTDALLIETNNRIKIINSEIEAMNKLNSINASLANPKGLKMLGQDDKAKALLGKKIAQGLPHLDTTPLGQELAGKNLLKQNLNASRAAYATIANARPADILKGAGGKGSSYIPPNSGKSGSGSKSTPSLTDILPKEQYYQNQITNVENQGKNLLSDEYEARLKNLDAIEKADKGLIAYYESQRKVAKSKGLENQLNEKILQVQGNIKSIEKDRKDINKSIVDNKAKQLEEDTKIAQDAINSYQNFLIKGVQSEIKELEASKKALQEKNQELKVEEERKQKLLEIEKQRQEIANIEKEKNTRIYSNGQWSWVADPKALREANEKLTSMKSEYDVWKADKQKEAEIQAIDDKIAKLQEFVDKSKTEYAEEKGEIQSYSDLIKKLSGVESGVYADRLKGLQGFVTEWNKIAKSMGLPEVNMAAPSTTTSGTSNKTSTATTKDGKTVDVTIKNGKTQDKLAVGTVVHTKGGDFKITGGTPGNYTSVKVSHDSGGEAPGKGLINKDIIAPERVLSPQQTKDFNKLVSMLPSSVEIFEKILNTVKLPDFNSNTPVFNSVSKSSSTGNPIVIQNMTVKADNAQEFMTSLNKQLNNLIAVRG